MREIEKARLSIVSLSTVEEIIPTDSEPMRLVLDDQSVNFKISPTLTYFRAGWGTVDTISIIVFFFLIYVLRVVSGKHLVFY
jgi:hypothetical protein